MLLIKKDYKNIKTKKRSYNAEILNYFNRELQLKYAESTIRKKLNDLLTELKEFQLVTTLVLEFEKNRI